MGSLPAVRAPDPPRPTQPGRLGGGAVRGCGDRLPGHQRGAAGHCAGGGRNGQVRHGAEGDGGGHGQGYIQVTTGGGRPDKSTCSFFPQFNSCHAKAIYRRSDMQIS